MSTSLWADELIERLDSLLRLYNSADLRRMAYDNMSLDESRALCIREIKKQLREWELCVADGLTPLYSIPPEVALLIESNGGELC